MADSGDKTPPRALDGVKVAVIGTVVTAPLTGRYFALHGATVVRVETHVRLDGIRSQRPFPGGKPFPDHSVWFANINSGALDISVDWTKPNGKKIVARLVRWADVVIENYTPGVLDRFGVGYHSIAQERPEVIYLSSCLMGQSGPWAGLAGLGTAGAAVAGLTHLTGWPDRPPTPIMTQYTDFVNPKFGVAAILGALEYRRRTGRGQHLDQAQVEGGVQLISPVVMHWLNSGSSTDRTGNHIAEAAPHNTYPCQGDDRWCAIAVVTDAQWAGLRRALQDEEWVWDERLATLLGRKDGEDQLDEHLASWTRRHTAEGVEALLQMQGVPASVVENARDTRDDVQLNDRGFFRTLHHNAIGEHTYRGPSFRLSRTPDDQRAGPTMGQHNFEVCAMLGLSDEEIAEAIVDGSLGTEPAL